MMLTRRRLGLADGAGAGEPSFLMNGDTVEMLQRRSNTSRGAHSTSPEFEHHTNQVEPMKQHPTSPGLVYDLMDNQVDPWQRFPFIRYGYRRNTGSATWREVAWGTFRMHNEALNAWTMIISLLAGMVLCWHHVHQAGVSGTDLLPFAALLLGQLIHTPASFCYHIMMPLSPSVANWYRRLDLSFILVMNACATFGLSYFTLGAAKAGLATLFVVITGLEGVRMLMAQRAGTELDRPRVVKCIGLTALGYYLPILYRGLAVLWQWLSHSRTDVVIVPHVGLPCETVIVALVFMGHSLGAWCYANHWPQCWWPQHKWISLWGHSHVIMHVALFTVYNIGYPYLAFLYKRQEAGAWPCAWPSSAEVPTRSDSTLLLPLNNMFMGGPLQQVARTFLMTVGVGNS